VKAYEYASTTRERGRKLERCPVLHSRPYGAIGYIAPHISCAPTSRCESSLFGKAQYYQNLGIHDQPGGAKELSTLDLKVDLAHVVEARIEDGWSLGWIYYWIFRFLAPVLPANSNLGKLWCKCISKSAIPARTTPPWRMRKRARRGHRMLCFGGIFLVSSAVPVGIEVSLVVVLC
jgi:hypothetical protein